MNFFKPVAFALAGSLVTLASVSYANDHTTLGAGPDTCWDQGNMQDALNHLRAARASLDKAEHNKGGWRDRAIKATDAALNETKNGCAVANH